MKFNISYFGPEDIFNARRDLILSLKYSLEENGHEAILSGKTIDPKRFNLILGAYFMTPEQVVTVINSKYKFAIINTEIIANGLLNYNPKKVDFKGVYLPFMKAGAFVWDLVPENLEKHKFYKTNGYLIKFGFLEKLHEIEHSQHKEFDYYFFGMISTRRLKLIQSLQKLGFKGVVDGMCPYFLRNDHIALSKVQLNLVQKNVYTHLNSLRVSYLANNRCAIVSDCITSKDNYLEDLMITTGTDELATILAELISGDRYQDIANESFEAYRKRPMKLHMEKLLDLSFSPVESDSLEDANSVTTI